VIEDDFCRLDQPAGYDVDESVQLRLPQHRGVDCCRVFAQPGRAEASDPFAQLVGQRLGALGTDAYIRDDREEEGERILVNQGIGRRIWGELGRSACELSR
jgi:hypothetical protein